MIDKQSDEERKRAKREANRVDLGGPVLKAPNSPSFRIYENTVNPEQFEPWLKQFLIGLVEPKPTGAPAVTAYWAELNHPIPILDLANTQLPMKKPFRLDMLIEGAALFSIHFAPREERVYVLAVGYDVVLLAGGFYPTMRERLEFAFPTAQPTIGKAEQPIHDDKRPMMHANRWLIEQYFEGGKTNLKQLIEEWLRRRKEEDYQEVPANPLSSMRTVIAEEKNRRKRNG